MKNRAFNFGAGPATLPLEILEEAQDELLNWQNSGMSILEIGHRTTLYQQLMLDLNQAFRDLLAIPDNHHVLFLGGPARLQFATIPLNFLGSHQQGAYIVTGLWSSLALAEAKRCKRAYSIPTSPENQVWQADTAYCYFTPNETVDGIKCARPDTPKEIPIVADMTSSLLTEVIAVQDYGFIFAGAQKNIANAGLTIAIVQDSLLQTIDDPTLPAIVDYRTHVSNQSLYATPPTFNCYLALKMCQWIKRQGGVEVLAAINEKKAALLYQYIDSSDFYYCAIEKSQRSLINICFRLHDAQLEPLFLEKSTENQLLALKGHRVVGGLRASLYNAMPLAGVESLIQFMDDFARSVRK